MSLNAIVHPMVMADFKEWASSYEGKAPYVILESAIIYEYNLNQHLNAVISVYLDKEERLRRLQLRDKTTREALEARMRNQLPAELKMERADYVILNYEGNPRARQVLTIHNLILSHL
jgi:dephospho-CoA kinase